MPGNPRTGPRDPSGGPPVPPVTAHLAVVHPLHRAPPPGPQPERRRGGRRALRRRSGEVRRRPQGRSPPPRDHARSAARQWPHRSPGDATRSRVVPRAEAVRAPSEAFEGRRGRVPPLAGRAPRDGRASRVGGGSATWAVDFGGMARARGPGPCRRRCASTPYSERRLPGVVARWVVGKSPARRARVLGVGRPADRPPLRGRRARPRSAPGGSPPARAGGSMADRRPGAHTRSPASIRRSQASASVRTVWRRSSSIRSQVL